MGKIPAAFVRGHTISDIPRPCGLRLALSGPQLKNAKDQLKIESIKMPETNKKHNNASLNKFFVEIGQATWSPINQISMMAC